MRLRILNPKFLLTIAVVLFLALLSGLILQYSVSREKSLADELKSSEMEEDRTEMELKQEQARAQFQQAIARKQLEDLTIEERTEIARSKADPALSQSVMATRRQREDLELRLVDLQRESDTRLRSIKDQQVKANSDYRRIEGLLVDERSERNITIAIAAVISLVTLTISLVLGYLRPSERSLKAAAPQTPTSLSDEIADIRRVIAEQTEARAGFDKDELLSSLRSTVMADLAGELEARFKSKALESISFSLMREMYKSDFERLFDQIALLRKRGNLNLAIGVAITLLAAGILIWATYGANSGFAKLTDVLSYYIPRVSTIAFIEVFAFFFLRLYKSTLAEEKFYQNELTARTARQVALEAALKSQEPGPLAAVITNLSLVDQNKGTTLSGAEAQPSEPMDLGKLLEGVAKIVSAVASKSQA